LSIFKWLNILVDCAATALIAVVAIMWAQNTFTISSEVRGIHITGPDVVKPGQALRVDYEIIRHRACMLNVHRIMERLDAGPFLGSEEVEVADAERVFLANRRPLPSHFVVTIPVGTLPGKYEIFSRDQYHCNGLDQWIPRFLVTPPVFFTVQ
jgi:hypothetical protein